MRECDDAGRADGRRAVFGICAGRIQLSVARRRFRPRVGTWHTNYLFCGCTMHDLFMPACWRRGRNLGQLRIKGLPQGWLSCCKVQRVEFTVVPLLHSSQAHAGAHTGKHLIRTSSRSKYHAGCCTSHSHHHATLHATSCTHMMSIRYSCVHPQSP